EARKHFATSYLYWHGRDHCWDASSGRRHARPNVQQKDNELVRGENREPKWREARSQLVPSDAAPPAPQSQPSEPTEAPPETSMSAQSSDRAVDLVQATSVHAQASDPVPSLKGPERGSGSAIAVGGLILILLGSMIIVALLEFQRR